MKNEQLFFGLTQVLRKFPKETGVLCNFCFKPKKVTNEVMGVDNFKKSQVLISNIIVLKTTLDALPLLGKVLKDASCFLLSNVFRTVCENEDYSTIRNRICEVFDEDVLHARVPFVARTQQCFAVKAGIDGLLDIARRTFCDTSEGFLVFLSPHSLFTFVLQSNGIFISEASNMLIVMGPNMSGKSTYLQQVCLTVILAQIGCYVPACFATIRIVDRIFTRMGSTDSLESNSSTFMTEMKETAFIMQNVTPRSLIVMDELGRATSSADGFSIAWSCCEKLLSIKAYTIFATHMENLSELATLYPNVRILHFDVDVLNNRLDFKFKLKDGPRHIPHYGLLLAEVAGLPRSVIDTAQCITSKITQTERKRMEVNCEQHHQLQMIYRAAQRLLCLKYSSQPEDAIRQALQNLKESYLDGTV
ncbi:unnamed protein product [Linum tenue]|uniref:DNA mismatch repair proteins mutS family domain-containing protein n=1 Tax=Linum tenue TaxID=586396 RepID=A0AAV0JT63_9ROSI|nr:unnamed protein product [Linum tenue]